MTFAIAVLLAATLFVAFANGANDNFKGVATLYGSGTTGFRGALAWATVTTAAGSLLSVALASELVKAFSAKGLVPDAVAQSPAFLASVALAAAVTVMTATVTGFPVSTTHAFLGGLIGAGLMKAGGDVQFAKLGTTFLLPLLVSPVIAVTLAGLLYPMLRWVRIRTGVTKEWCVCVGGREQLIPIPSSYSAAATAGVAGRSPIGISIDTDSSCSEQYRGSVLGVNIQKMLDAAHFLSAGAVSFSRGLNDTPKVVGLLLSLQLLDIRVSLVGVAVVMALGGILQSRKVAETVGHDITSMNHGQGFVANIVTAFIVFFASRFGVPVSTTHVSCGALFGIGASTRRGNPKVIGKVLAAWAITLPFAAAVAMTVALILR